MLRKSMLMGYVHERYFARDNRLILGIVCGEEDFERSREAEDLEEMTLRADIYVDVQWIAHTRDGI